MRLFVAVPLPRELTDRAAALFPEALPGLKPVRPELMHVTLAFLGWTADDRLPEVVEAARAATVGQPAFDLTFGRAGRFPASGRPRVAWLGVADGGPALEAIAAHVSGELRARAPRTNQAIVGTLSLVAILTGWWGILAALALQLAIGLTFGRRYCLPCLLYFELIQPRLGEGPIEDSRPPRFANMVGVAFLTAATVAYATGLVPAGQALAGIVAALALLAATTGLCVGCEIYRLAARFRGVRSRVIDRVDLGELGAVVEGEVVVEFTHPLCTDFRALERTLSVEGRPMLTIDVSPRPDIARKYGVVVVPTPVLVGADGVVRARIA